MHSSATFKIKRRLKNEFKPVLSSDWQGHNSSVRNITQKRNRKSEFDGGLHRRWSPYVPGIETRGRLTGTVGGTRIVTLEVKLEDRRNTNLSESRCQVCLC